LLERLDFDTTRTHALLLTSCPELHYLAQGQQFLPVLTLLEPAQIVGGCAGPHPLRVLTIPWLIARFLREVVALLPHLSSLIVEGPS